MRYATTCRTPCSRTKSTRCKCSFTALSRAMPSPSASGSCHTCAELVGSGTWVGTCCAAALDSRPSECLTVLCALRESHLPASWCVGAMPATGPVRRPVVSLSSCWTPWSTQETRGLWARPPVLLPVPSQAIHSRACLNLHHCDIQSTAQKSPCVNTFLEAIVKKTTYVSNSKKKSRERIYPQCGSK